MDKKFFVPLGILLFFIGVTLVLNTISGITGLVVIEDVSQVGGSLAGVVFITLGVLSFIFGTTKKPGKQNYHSLIEERGNS